GFTDTYWYWPNGRLRERWTSRSGQEPSGEFYDEAGHRVAEPIQPKGQTYFDSGVELYKAKQYPEAREQFGRALETATQEQDLQGMAANLILLANIDLAEGKDQSAIEKANRALPLGMATKDPNLAMSSWSIFGQVEWSDARRALQEERTKEAEDFYKAARM